MEQQARAVITRGGVPISSYNNKGEEISEKKNIKSNVQNINKAIKTDDLVGKIKLVAGHGVLVYRTAASLIVGEMRKIYFSSITRPDSYDIKILNYMDKILFNNLTDIIEGIIRYGSDCFPKSIIEQTIADVVAIMETQPNTKAMYHIVDRLYEEF